MPEMTPEELKELRAELRKQVREQIGGQAEGFIAIIEEILSIANENEALVDEILSFFANVAKKANKAYIEAGFTKDQAFQLTANLMQTFNKSASAKRS